MKRTLIIILWLKNNKTMTLDIPNPRDNLTASDVRIATFELLKRNVIISPDGIMATAFKHAYIRKVDEELLP